MDVWRAVYGLVNFDANLEAIMDEFMVINGAHHHQKLFSFLLRNALMLVMIAANGSVHGELASKTKMRNL